MEDIRKGKERVRFEDKEKKWMCKAVVGGIFRVMLKAVVEGGGGRRRNAGRW